MDEGVGWDEGKKEQQARMKEQTWIKELRSRQE